MSRTPGQWRKDSVTWADGEIPCTILGWAEMLEESYQVSVPWAYDIMRQHLWDVFCVSWIVVSHCLIIGRE